MKKFVKVIAGLTCVATLGVSLGGCSLLDKLGGLGGGSKLSEGEVNALKNAFGKTAAWEGSYDIYESQSCGMYNTEQKATYDANTGDMYFYNDITALRQNEYEFLVYTKAVGDGFTQYIDYGVKQKKTDLTESSIYSQGAQGKHFVTGEQTPIYSTKLVDAMRKGFLFSASAAAEQQTESAMSDYLLRNVGLIVMANEMQMLGLMDLDSHTTYNKESSKVEEKSNGDYYTFKWTFEDDDTTGIDYSSAMEIQIQVNDNNDMVGLLTCVIEHDYTKVGESQQHERGTFSTSIRYEYDDTDLPDTSLWP